MARRLAVAAVCSGAVRYGQPVPESRAATLSGPACPSTVSCGSSSFSWTVAFRCCCGCWGSEGYRLVSGFRCPPSISQSPKLRWRRENFVHRTPRMSTTAAAAEGHPQPPRCCCNRPNRRHHQTSHSTRMASKLTWPLVCHRLCRPLFPLPSIVCV